MIYNTKVEKRNSESDSEYRQAELHSNRDKKGIPEEQSMVIEICPNECKCKNLKITLEFPEQTDEAAEREFISRLKEIYLEKIKKGSMQEKDSALTFNPTNGEEDMLDG